VGPICLINVNLPEAKAEDSDTCCRCFGSGLLDIVLQLHSEPSLAHSSWTRQSHLSPLLWRGCILPCVSYTPLVALYAGLAARAQPYSSVIHHSSRGSWPGQLLPCHCCFPVRLQHIRHYPPNLRYAATLPWEIKNSNFLQIFSRCVRKCKQIVYLSPLTLLLIHKFLYFRSLR